EARYDLGVVLANRGDLERAEQELARAHASAPEAEDVVVALAEVRRRRGEPAGAVEVLEAFVAAQPRALTARTALVAALRGVGAVAFRHFQAAAELDPRDATAQLNMGSVLLMAGVYDRAATAFRSVLENEPANVDAALGLAAALRGLGSREDATPYAEAERL